MQIDQCRVDVDKSEFDGNISFGRAEDGRNFAIVISKVEPGSASDKVTPHTWQKYRRDLANLDCTHTIVFALIALTCINSTRRYITRALKAIRSAKPW